MTDLHTPHNHIKLAFIIDGEVVDTFFTFDRFAAILQSNPTIVDISNSPEVNIGDIYDEKSKTFKDPLDD